jgi:chromosome segregation ATPase
VSHDVDIQLQVWKDLAISKQILMGAAADALGLDSECSTDELKTALDKAIQRAREADIKIQETLTESEQQITEFKRRAEIAEQARSEAEAMVEESVNARAQAERQLANGKADNAEALKKARAEVTEKQNKLKAISKALADTPENVVRKLKTQTENFEKAEDGRSQIAWPGGIQVTVDTQGKNQAGGGTRSPETSSRKRRHAARTNQAYA